MIKTVFFYSVYLFATNLSEIKNYLIFVQSLKSKKIWKAFQPKTS